MSRAGSFDRAVENLPRLSLLLVENDARLLDRAEDALFFFFSFFFMFLFLFSIVQISLGILIHSEH